MEGWMCNNNHSWPYRKITVILSAEIPLSKIPQNEKRAAYCANYVRTSMYLCIGDERKKEPHNLARVILSGVLSRGSGAAS